MYLGNKRPSGGARSAKKQAVKELAGSAASVGRGEKPGSFGGVGGILVRFDGPLAITADELLHATVDDRLSTTMYRAYKATLKDGSLVGVKHLDKMITKGHGEFMAEAAVIGKIRRPNLLPLKAYYLMPKGNNMLVFDYMLKGSLAEFLARESDSSSLSCILLSFILS